MFRSARLPLFRRHAVRLLLLGVLAVFLHALAGTGLMAPATAAGKGASYAAEVCTSHGLVKLDPGQMPTGGSQPDSGMHDCCKLCAAGGPLLAADIPAGVAPAPTFAILQAAPAAARPTPAAWTAHAPRGPPPRA